MDLSALEADPRLFLYTSLTAGSSHIITATSRMETILKANKIPFQAIDTATDEKARRLWQRRAGQRKLPGLVKEGYVIADLEEVEEWNEYGELKDNIGPVPSSNAAPPGGQTGINFAPPLTPTPTPTAGPTKVNQPDAKKGVALPGAEEIAAKNRKGCSDSAEAPTQTETITSVPTEKRGIIETAQKAVLSHHGIDHLSAPPSALQSGTASPAPERAETDDATTTMGGTEVSKTPVEGDKNTEHPSDKDAVAKPLDEKQASETGPSVEG
ncbi:hypothetical protein M433DRAFT_1179 [Acidomyces richmondensis BFW]|nr:MAG: hypothetical protein FE78DRAFT_30077 [Acidomyces sp. 'richmondensis']KYG49383.1 hypothetical protein M433DRAFT_1179 [Acidomyces richmondensis BFW]